LALITLSGIDNAGKSTQIANLTRYLQERGKAPVVLWSRGGYTGGFSALKIWMRRLWPGSIPPPGHSEQREAVLRRVRVRTVWLALALLDLIRVYGINIRWWRLRGRTIICDRYLWDTLIDFRLNFPEETVETWWLWRFLTSLSPKPDASVLLMIPLEESIRRSEMKQEPFADPPEVRARRYVMYEELSATRDWHVIQATGTPDHVFARLTQYLQDNGII